MKGIKQAVIDLEESNVGGGGQGRCEKLIGEGWGERQKWSQRV